MEQATTETTRIRTERIYSDPTAKILKHKYYKLWNDKIARIGMVIILLACLVSLQFLSAPLTDIPMLLVYIFFMVFPLITVPFIIATGREIKKLKAELQPLLPAMLVETDGLWLRDSQSKSDGAPMIKIEPGLYPLENSDWDQFLIKGTDIFGTWGSLRQADKESDSGISLIRKV